MVWNGTTYCVFTSQNGHCYWHLWHPDPLHSTNRSTLRCGPCPYRTYQIQEKLSPCPAPRKSSQSLKPVMARPPATSVTASGSSPLTSPAQDTALQIRTPDFSATAGGGSQACSRAQQEVCTARSQLLSTEV